MGERFLTYWRTTVPYLQETSSPRPLYCEGQCTVFLWNIGNHSHTNSVSHPKRFAFPTATLQQTHISHIFPLLTAEKLELWAGNSVDETDVQLSPTTAQFEYLGFITLSDNQKTGFKSRELKSVTVPSCAARYLKLRLHANHLNSLNVHNQVSTQ